ncbi:MAG: Colicin receptor precursor [Pseudomonadota bacterium]|jgi:iron complex outermembrane receptor protein
MKTRTRTIASVLYASTALIAAAAAFPASAQTAPPTSPEAAGPLEEIIVTARRREESLQDVPVAITAFSAEALDLRGDPDITAIAQVTPNLTLEASRGTNSTLTAFMRGVGQQDPVAGFEGGVGIYLDDVYLNRPQGALLDIYDVERIEVLRGPQGTLYGRNTIGGAVKYVTKRLATEPTFRIRGALGSYRQADLVVSGSAPITDKVRIGGAVARLTRNGYGENLTTGDENYDKDITAARLSLEIEPTDSLLIRISGDITQDDSNARQGHRVLPSVLANGAVLSGRYDTRAGVTRLGPIDDNEVSAKGGQINVEWEATDYLTLKSITAARSDESDAPIDFDSTAARTFDVPAIYENEQFSQEFQGTLDFDRLRGVVGFYYLDANAFNAFDAIITNPATPTTSIASFTLGDVDTKAWAVFGEMTFDVTEQIALTLGGRYTEDERKARVYRENFLGAPSRYFGNTAATSITTPVVVNGVQVVPNFTGERTDTDFNPRAILAWLPTDDYNFYVSYSEGFKGGLFDPRGNFANATIREGVRPETVETYEIGAKMSLLDGRLRTNIAVFTSDYTDVQIPGSVTVALPGGGTTFQGTLTNAGAAEISGLEVEATAALTDNLTAIVALGYLDAEYTEFIVNGVNIANQRDVQNTPDWTGSGSLNYTTDVTAFGRTGSLSVIGTTSYRSKTQQFEFAIPLLDQDAYWLMDASIVWTSESGHYRFGLHGKNLTDKRYITSGYNFPGASTDNSILAFYGNPRTITATAEYRF